MNQIKPVVLLINGLQTNPTTPEPRSPGISHRQAAKCLTGGTKQRSEVEAIALRLWKLLGLIRPSLLGWSVVGSYTNSKVQNCLGQEPAKNRPYP